MMYNIHIEEGLNSIEVFDGRKFTYRFTPAIFSKGAPLFVIASARGTKVPAKFTRDDWNVLSVVDTFGRKGDMTAYLGEKGNFFIKELLYELVQAAIKKCECVPRDNLFFYSSSIASGSGIAQGILSDARAVYLNAPIIKVHDTTIYKSKHMDYDKAVDFVIPPHMKNVIEADGVRYLKAHSHKKLPTFILCDSMHQSEPWLQNFLEEHALYFVQACKEEGVDVHLELVDTEGHKRHHNMNQVIEIFEKYTAPKYLDLLSVRTSLDGNNLKVSCVLGKDYPITGKEQYAFYLYYKEKRVKVCRYSQEFETEFILDEDMSIAEIEVKGFVLNRDKKKIVKKVQII